MRKSLYMPGTDVVDITAPGGIDALLTFHRATFGDARMEDDGDGGDGDDDGADDAGGNDGKVGDLGFPDKTPVKEMTDAQQAAYWRHQARKHEDRSKATADYDAIKAERDALKEKHQTAEERAIEEARAQGAQQARADHLPRLVRAEFKAAAGGRIPADKLGGILEPLDLTKFLTADGGEVDTDKVQQYVDGLIPAGGQWPDMGQGHRSTEKTAGVSAGRDLYADRRSKK